MKFTFGLVRTIPITPKVQVQSHGSTKLQSENEEIVCRANHQNNDKNSHT